MSKQTDSTKPKEPISLRHYKAKKLLYDAVKEANQIYGIPYFLIEDIMAELFHQVKDNARTERENSLREYDKQIEEYNREQEADNEEGECKKQ